MPLLEATGITVRFGGITAVAGADICADAGTITGLIGPNGAGKTTLFNALNGLQRPQAGRIVLGGTDITGFTPARRARAGLARTFQRLELFLSLSVRDNLRVAGDIHRAITRSRMDVNREVDRVLGLTGLADVADHDVSTIATGRARIVEVARAVMTRPRVLLLDEPVSGQTQPEIDRFAEMLRGLADAGLAVFLVDHHVPTVARLCSLVHVLDRGAVIAAGAPEDVVNNLAVVTAYLGTWQAS
jgi:branched-chain amino acid transport system ATP-binding protein